LTVVGPGTTVQSFRVAHSRGFTLENVGLTRTIGERTIGEGYLLILNDRSWQMGGGRGH